MSVSGAAVIRRFAAPSPRPALAAARDERRGCLRRVGIAVVGFFRRFFELLTGGLDVFAHPFNRVAGRERTSADQRGESDQDFA